MKQRGSVFLEGLRGPFVVLAHARAAGAPFARYRRLVWTQLLLTLVALAVAFPLVVDGEKVAGARVAVAGMLGSPAVEQKTQAPSRKKKHKNGSDDEVEASTDSASIETDKDDDDDAPPGFVRKHFPRLAPIWILLATLYGVWLIVDWAVASLYYEHNDALTDALAVTVEVPSNEGPPRPPKLRVDLRWMARKLWRQGLGVVMFVSAAPFLILVRLLPDAVAQPLEVALVSAWSIYWLLVTTAAKSELAWSEPALRMPFYLRAWTFLTTRVFGFRWWAPRQYGQLWAWITRRIHRAGELAERHPEGLTGVAVLRLVGKLPVLSVMLRPIVPVCASIVVHRHIVVAPPAAASNVRPAPDA